MLSGRQYATGVDDTTIIFECERFGHTYQINYSKRPLTQRMGSSACKMMASWWSKAKGGCIGECPKCKKLEIKAAPPCPRCKSADVKRERNYGREIKDGRWWCMACGHLWQPDKET